MGGFGVVVEVFAAELKTSSKRSMSIHMVLLL